MTKQKKITAAVALIAVIAIVIVSIFLMSGNAGSARVGYGGSKCDRQKRKNKSGNSVHEE